MKKNKSELFEYPLPSISVEIDKLVLSICNYTEGCFYIKNIGGGVLKGWITSNTGCVKFSPEKFEANSIHIKYSADVSMFSSGALVQSNIVISSNGGEKIIPIIINVTQQALEISDGSQISSLNDFLTFARREPVEARRMLGSNNFFMWLNTIGYEHMDMFEHIISDSNKERALDNFFVLSGLKKRAGINSEKNSYKLKINDCSIEPVAASCKISKIGWGYIDYPVMVKNSAPWLKLKTEKISSKQFEKSQNSLLEYEIDPKKITGSYEEDYICIAAEKAISIKIGVFRVSAVKVKLNKEVFNTFDSGNIIIENNSGKNLLFNIIPSDGFIKFDAQTYIISKKQTITFNIKLSALTKTQMDFVKKPFVRGKIKISTVINDKPYIFIKNITVTLPFKQ